jgi:hypothetical protein
MNEVFQDSEIINNGGPTIIHSPPMNLQCPSWYRTTAPSLSMSFSSSAPSVLTTNWRVNRAVVRVQSCQKMMLSHMAIFGPVAALYNCDASFRHYQFDRPPRRSYYSVLRSNNRLSSLSLRASYQSTNNNKKRSSLDSDIAAQFTIQVCTSTSCTRKLTDVGLDQYHVLGELYAQAQAVNLEQVMIIEDGGCQGGKNCKMGPCVAILHDEFDGNVALEGMNSNEFTERVCVS